MSTPIIGSDGMLIPHAKTFASLVNAVNKTYSYRWDEALRDNQLNALAMRRDVYLRGLLQERLVPTINRGWQLAIEDEADPRQREVRDGLTRVIRSTPRFKRLKANLLEAVWYGRYGVQFQWSRDRAMGWAVTQHKPVNGDKIQFQWDDTPVVLINSAAASDISRVDPSAVIATDRGGFGLRLDKPEWRDRFAIHKHIVDDADYFEGEMAGGVHGVGLRSIVYWGNWLRTETLTWMLSFMQSTGMMDLLIFNYPDGNYAAKLQAEENARAITNKIAIAYPRDASASPYPAVETVPANTAGMAALQNLIDNYFDRHIERLFVGQSMSSGRDGAGSLGGTGRAEFARDTKDQLLEWDADNLDETLTTDFVDTARRYNYPWADFPVRFESIIPNPNAATKVAAGIQLIQASVPIKASELREAAGFSNPGDGDEVVGGVDLPGLDR